MRILTATIKTIFISTLLFSFPLQAATVANYVSTLPGNPTLPDVDINSALLEKVAKDSIISSLNVSITTQKGIVSLQGKVNSETEAEQFIAVASSIPGVQDVDVSQLTTVQSGPLPIELILTAKVKGALVRGKAFGDTTVNSLPISVITSNGIVYLKGIVDSTAQMIYVIKLAQATPGVPRVISELVVRQVQSVGPN